MPAAAPIKRSAAYGTAASRVKATSVVGDLAGSSSTRPQAAETVVAQPSPALVATPSYGVVSDLETILQERDACGVRRQTVGA